MLFQFWGGHASNVGVAVYPRTASRGVVCPGDAEEFLKAIDGLVVGGIEPRAKGDDFMQNGWRDWMTSKDSFSLTRPPLEEFPVMGKSPLP